MFRRLERTHPLPSIADRFGIRGREQVLRDLGTVASHLLRLPTVVRDGVPAAGGDRFAVGISSAGLLRPDLALPAYAGLVPSDGISPVFNFFDRVGGGRGYRAAVTRRTARDWRGGRLTYDEHDGTDLVCPPGTPLVVAAPGVVVATRDDWLRGGLTAIVDHGSGVVTQYTHLSVMVAEVGQTLARGETVALSGASGLDMTHAFPLVPPHIHFMVWIDGTPVDPFRAPGEALRPGLWMHGNAPEAAAGPLTGDPAPPRIADIAVADGAIERLLALCKAASIRAEVDRAPSDAARVAICEDSLHHQRWAWPASVGDRALRPRADAARVRLTLPLPASIYRGIRAADAPWTRPPS